MICCHVAVWWEGPDAPGQERDLYAAFSSEREYKRFDWESAAFGLFDRDECSWEVTQCQVEWLDIPRWAQKWVSDNGIPNGVIPDRVEESISETQQLLARTDLPEDRKEFFRQELDFLRAWAERLRNGGAR